MRLGGLAVGLLLGTLLGALLAVALHFAGYEAHAFVAFAGGVVLLGLVGFVMPGGTLAFGEAALHLVIGFVSGSALENPTPSALAPLWLKRVLAAGVVLGIGAFIFWSS